MKDFKSMNGGVFTFIIYFVLVWSGGGRVGKLIEEIWSLSM